MTGKEFQYVRDVLENEGIHYGLNDYTDFKKEVRDPVFHLHLDAYHKALKELLDYVGYQP